MVLDQSLIQFVILIVTAFLIFWLTKGKSFLNYINENTKIDDQNKKFERKN